MKQFMVIKKIIALFLDYICMIISLIAIHLVLSVLIAIYIGVVKGFGNTVDVNAVDLIQLRLFNVLAIIFLFVYYSHALKKSSQTLGERIMKIKIIPAYGGRISLLSGIIRTVFLAPVLAIIGFIPVSRTPYKSLLDHICLTKTVSVDEEK